MSSRQNNHLPARGSSSLDNPPSRGSSSGSGHGQGAGAGYGQGQGESKWASAAASIESDYDGQRSWEHVDDEPEDFDSSSWLDRKTKKVQNDSLNTSRRALEKMENAQGIAQSNLSKLASQSGALVCLSCLYVVHTHNLTQMYRTTLWSRKEITRDRLPCANLRSQNRPIKGFKSVLHAPRFWLQVCEAP